MTIEERMQAAINQMAADIADMDAEIERLKEENGALQVALDNAQDEVKRLTAIAEKVEGLQQIAAELNAANVGLKQKVTRLESDNRAAERENERLESRLTDIMYDAKEKGRTKMSNELEDQLRSIAGASELEQATAGFAALASMLGEFYASLIVNEIPPDLAYAIVIEFMRINMPRKAE